MIREYSQDLGYQLDTGDSGTILLNRIPKTTSSEETARILLVAGIQLPGEAGVRMYSDWLTATSGSQVTLSAYKFTYVKSKEIRWTKAASANFIRLKEARYDASAPYGFLEDKSLAYFYGDDEVYTKEELYKKEEVNTLISSGITTSLNDMFKTFTFNTSKIAFSSGTLISRITIPSNSVPTGYRPIAAFWNGGVDGYSTNFKSAHLSVSRGDGSGEVCLIQSGSTATNAAYNITVVCIKAAYL